MTQKAVVVLSGGLDSTTCMGIAENEGFSTYPITFRYGQKHDREVEQAKKVARFFNVLEHKMIDMDFLRDIGGSALTDDAIDIPLSDSEEDIPATYVPARNMIFLSLAAAYAEVIGARVIYIGVSAVDFSGYPDCRPEFIRSMNQTVNLATKTGTQQNLTIEAPLIHLSKAETIRKGMEFEVPYHLTTSCYVGNETACGQCDSCRLRIQGFKEAGYRDPIPYAVSID